MSTYIQNYGITKTLIKDSEHNLDLDHQIKWVGNYDGNNANITLDINNNGSKEFVSMNLDNDDLMKLLSIHPVEMSLENRLSRDFLGKSYKPITLEGALIKRRKTRKHKNKKHYRNHKRRTYKYASK